MIKEYRKTATIKAEQFDGSDEMIDEYEICVALYSNAEKSKDYCLVTKEGPLNINVGDWIATGVEGEHWAIADDIFRKTYEEVE